MRRVLAALAIALTLASSASAGTTVQRRAVKISHGTRLTYLMRGAIVGDPQNYFTRVDVGQNLAVAADLFRREIDDIIAYKPNFAIIVGDLTDGPSGLDEQCNAWRISDDLDLSGVLFGKPAGYYQASWTDIRTKGYDRLVAAGIPVFTVLGNHDSCVEYQRTFPAAEWSGLTAYSAEVLTDPNHLCGGGTYSDNGASCGSQVYGASANLAPSTTHRKALYPTPIGTICVIGEPNSTFDIDPVWVAARVGCSADRPTIFVSHWAQAGQLGTIFSSLTTAQKSGAIATISGHLTPCVDCGTVPKPALSAQVFVGGVWPNLWNIFVNAQEQLSGGIGDSGGLAHTGMSWWSSWEINPKANTATLTAHNPYLGGSTDALPSDGFVMKNTTVGLTFDWCTRFGGPECP